MTVYCVSDYMRKALKIGFTQDSDPIKRVRSLQTASPFKLDLLYYRPDMSRKDEEKLHGILAPHRTNGGSEWFDFELSIEIVAEYMGFDPNCIELPQKTTPTAKPKPLQKTKNEPQQTRSRTKKWFDFGITEGKMPYCDSDGIGDMGSDDDTDYCPVLSECVTKYASKWGIDPAWLLWPDSYFHKPDEYHYKFIPRQFHPATYSELSKELIRGTHGENWNPSQVMAKIISCELCSLHLFIDLDDFSELGAPVYPLLSDSHCGHLLLMCFVEPKDYVDVIEETIEEFFWDLDCYEMTTSFLIIDKTHNYYEATHHHPLTQLTRQEINRLRLGDMAAT